MGGEGRHSAHHRALDALGLSMNQGRLPLLFTQAFTLATSCLRNATASLDPFAPDGQARLN